jgi:hypothetical protein
MKKQLFIVRASNTTWQKDYYVVATSKEKAELKIKEICKYHYVRVIDELGEVIL